MVALSRRLCLLSLVVWPPAIWVSRRVALMRRDKTATLARRRSRLQSQIEERLSVSGALLTKTLGADRSWGCSQSACSGSRRWRSSAASSATSTSALDNVAERELQAALDRLVAGPTPIAHRPSTVDRADRIVVLQRGRIAEAGDHNQLRTRGGVYAGLVGPHAARGGHDPAPGRAIRSSSGDE